jgi:hypothetical protein
MLINTERRRRSPLIKGRDYSVCRLDNTIGIYLLIHYGYIGRIGKKLKAIHSLGAKDLRKARHGKNAVLNLIRKPTL